MAFASSSLTPPSHSFSIIVHCHLHWDFVWQRPQQFLSRLSKKHRVLFVENAFFHNGLAQPYAEILPCADYPNISILHMHLDRAHREDEAYIVAQSRRLLEETLRGPLKGKFDRAVEWFYNPMSVEAHLGQHQTIATVYDCMDELSQFKNAPKNLVEREARLLKAADVVFAGGRKMWQSKSRHNSNAHFYGCGVDVAHFGKARLNSTEIPFDIRHIEGPILGFFGVVDERMDYDLIARLSDAHPEWNLVIVGPVAKVNPADFPRAANIHWLDGRDYAHLPHYTKAFDVALMPFALNEATEYINPTKALEYMATGTPIVSTPVPDVVSNFASVVKISRDSDDFVRLCEAQVAQVDKLAVERGLKMAQENTWDAIVAKLEKHVEDAIAKKAAREKPVASSLSSSQIAVSAA
ncbi:MAG TPA: glycosyltransferase [Abditibacterium sp.]